MNTRIKADRFSTLWASLLLVGIFLISHPVSAQDGPFDIDKSPLPEPTSPVMDYAGVIDSETEEAIEQRILDFAESSDPKVEMAVAVVDTTGNIDIFDYSLAVARGWGIGARVDDDPGLLLFIAIKDRKYFTQVSLDLEDELPDGVVGSIQRSMLVPEFKKGNYGKGIADTIDAYIKTVEAKQAGEEPPFGGETEEKEEFTDYDDYGPSASDIICCAIGIIAFIIFIVWSVQSSNKGGRGGGGKGRKRKSNIDVGEVLIDIAGGLVIGALTGGGGSSSSSSSSWGGSSGGSWGGFGGGGSFGGGGAGGSW
ncbi:MAG: hypothetical protein HKN33_02910 [Pyrinomonadaceae bacterium]|nr:hypothetical protein [Pyrinomonadaceae bacterium]